MSAVNLWDWYNLCSDGHTQKEHKAALHGDEEIVQFVVRNTVSDIRKIVNNIKNKTPPNVSFSKSILSEAIQNKISAAAVTAAAPDNIKNISNQTGLLTGYLNIINISNLARGGRVCPESDAEAGIIVGA